LRIGTAKRFQKRGFAAALLAHLFCILKERGCKSIFLEVRSQNIPAKSLYEKIGFEQIATRHHYYKNPSDDALIYQKKL
jgi:ribosomal-protein-alanine N-acetyltransferase